MRNELNVLLEKLRQLRIQETRVIEEIEALNLRQTDDNDNSSNTATGLVVGDRVSFNAAPTSTAGTGRVVGFTRGEQPFVRIKRDDGPGDEIKRKPHTIYRIY